MAKKPENIIRTILHAIIMVFGVLTLAFFALPYFSSKILGNTTGYDLLDFSEITANSPKFSAVVTLLIVIVACVLIVASLLALLNDFDVISNDKFKKIINWMLLVSAVVLTILAVLNMIACPTYISDKNLGSYMSAGWAGLVLNLIFGIGSTVCAGTASKKN